MKYKFVSSQPDVDTNEVKYINKNQGSIVTQEYEATVGYRFDKNDVTIELNIEEQWFTHSDLLDLEAFIAAAKKRLLKIQAKNDSV